jgi:hypothetical protein
VTLQHWSGTLVDAHCAGEGGSAAGSSAAAQSGDRSDAGNQNASTSDPADTNAGGHGKGHRSRAKASDTQKCPVTSSTGAFGLMTKDGQTLRFDDVGNARAAQEIKNKQKWSKQLSDGKPIHVKVDGSMDSNNTITVTDIH